MCIQDVRMGRLKTPEGNNQTINCADPGAQLIGANANRAGVVLTLTGSAAETGGYVVRVMAGKLSGPVIAGLSVERPSVLLRVEDYGRAITGPLWGFGQGGMDSEVNVTELVWHQDPEGA